MVHERNALQEQVFPRLRELANANGCGFQAIDLRWGVSEEAGKNHQTMRICLGEIARCQLLSPKPNFIVLLGDRYGWSPLPSSIPEIDFLAILKNVSMDEAETINNWYHRDDNAVPPEYVLLPRKRELSAIPKNDFERLVDSLQHQPEQGKVVKCWYQFGKDSSLLPDQYFPHFIAENGIFILTQIDGVPESRIQQEHDEAIHIVESFFWAEIEIEIHAILEKATADFPQSKRIAYTASATEQEITAGALQIPFANQHVYCYFRRMENVPKDGYNIPYVETDQVNANKLRDLKDRLRNHVPDNIREFSTQWSQSGPMPSYIQKICDNVYEDLSKIILSEIEGSRTVDISENEIVRHQEIADNLSTHFFGRMDLLKIIDEYIDSINSYPLVIWGKSGSGKTALIAKAIKNLDEPGRVLVYRFIGGTPQSINIRELLESLCKQISFQYGSPELSLPSKYDDLLSLFKKILSHATEEKPLVILLDALDQLSIANDAHELAWLPTSLPPHVSLIVTMTPGDCLEKLMNNPQTLRTIEVPPLTLKEGETILDHWFLAAGRRLQDFQKEHVLCKFINCPSPLFLKMAYEEAMRWRSFERLIELKDDIPEMTVALIDRLSKDSDHGRSLVTRSLSYIAASRYGLSEEELLDILSNDKDALNDFQRRSPNSPIVTRLPVILWSRLYFDLEPYLTWRGVDGTTVLNFFHRQIWDQVFDSLLSDNNGSNYYHKLSEYFTPKNLERNNSEGPVLSLRTLSELPHLLSHAQKWDQTVDTISDPGWICASVLADRVFTDLPQTILEASNICPDDEFRQILDNIFEAIRMEGVHFLNCPDASTVASQLDYHLSGTGLAPVDVFRERYESRCRSKGYSFFRTIYRKSIGQRNVLCEHNADVSLVVVTSDSKYGASVDSAGQLIGFNPITGEKRWVTTLLTSIEDGRYPPGDVNRRTYIRYAKPLRMILTEEGYPQCWIAARDNKTTFDSSEYNIHIFRVDLRTGKELQVLVFDLDIKYHYWYGFQGYKTFLMDLSPDGKRIVVEGVIHGNAHAHIVIDVRTGDILKEETRRLNEISSDLVSHLGERLIFLKGLEIWVEDIITSTLTSYGTLPSRPISAEFASDRSTLIIQLNEKELISISSPGDPPVLFLSFQDPIESWLIHGGYIVCISGDHLFSYALTNQNGPFICDVDGYRRLSRTSYAGLIRLTANNRDDRYVDLNGGRILQGGKDPLYHKDLVLLPHLGWMNIASDGKKLLLCDLGQNGAAGERDPISKYEKNIRSYFDPNLLKVLDNPSNRVSNISVSPDTALFSWVDSDRSLVVYERKSGELIHRIECDCLVDHCLFDTNDRILVWDDKCTIIVDVSQSVKIRQIRMRERGDDRPPQFFPDSSLLVRSLDYYWGGIGVYYVPLKLKLRSLPYQGKLKDICYDCRNNMLITYSDKTHIWSLRLIDLLVGGVISLIIRIVAHVSLLPFPPSYGNVVRKVDDVSSKPHGWSHPIIRRSGRFIDRYHSGKIIGRWLKEDITQRTAFDEDISNKATDLNLSLNEKVAVFIESEKLSRVDTTNGTNSIFYNQVTLEKVWLDADGSLIIMQDKYGDICAVEWEDNQVL